MTLNLSCFKAYDIRGVIGVEFDNDIAYRVGYAVAQHFDAKSIVVGFDARETGPTFAAVAAKGAMDAGADVIDIGMAGTEEMYWAVTEFSTCAGIQVTASHNPINYNGMKIVKSGSRPLHVEDDFKTIKYLAETKPFLEKKRSGRKIDRSAEARRAYVDRVLTFADINVFKPLKIVVNSGNGAAGPTFDAIAKKLSNANVPLEFFRINHTPDHTFPNGIPNPILSKNHFPTAKAIKEIGADFGIAFDGDFDRCFFFDEAGTFVPGEYIVGLLASIFLDREPGATIVHDPRVIWNTQNIVKGKGGKAVQSKTGHAFIKQAMREQRAIYGGEISAHHYFRDFAYCDSGMVPWLLISELVSKSGRSMADWTKDRFDAFPSSGETNFRVKNASASIAKVLAVYRADAVSMETLDGVSLTFSDWRFNLRSSNTEPLVRLNVECFGDARKLGAKVTEIANLLGGTRE